MTLAKKWYAVINTYVTFREGELHMPYAFKTKEMRDRKFDRLKAKAEIIKRTDFEKEFIKATIVIEEE